MIKIPAGYLKEYHHYDDGTISLRPHQWDGCWMSTYLQYLKARRIRQKFIREWELFGHRRYIKKSRNGEKEKEEGRDKK